MVGQLCKIEVAREREAQNQHRPPVSMQTLDFVPPPGPANMLPSYGSPAPYQNIKSPMKRQSRAFLPQPKIKLNQQIVRKYQNDKLELQ